MSHIKFFDLQAEPVADPRGGFVNYPSQVSVDTNPKFRHLLSAQELVMLDQSARIAALEAELETTKKLLKRDSEHLFEVGADKAKLIAALEKSTQIMVTFGMTYPASWSKKDQATLNKARAVLAEVTK